MQGPFKNKPTQEMKSASEVVKQLGGNNSSDVNSGPTSNNANAADDDFISND